MGESSWFEPDDFCRKVFAEMSMHVVNRPQADNPYHVSQLHIILDRTESLLDAFAHGLREGIYDTSSSEYVAFDLSIFSRHTFISGLYHAYELLRTGIQY